jgi:hypothetical protein
MSDSNSLNYSGYLYPTTTTSNTCNITIQTVGGGGNVGIGSSGYGNASSSANSGLYSAGSGGPGYTYSYVPIYEKWPDVEGSVGLIFIKNDKIMIRLDDGEEKEIADLSESEIEMMTSLLAIAAKKKLQRT